MEFLGVVGKLVIMEENPRHIVSSHLKYHLLHIVRTTRNCASPLIMRA
jgi:hypothetical protein